MSNHVENLRDNAGTLDWQSADLAAAELRQAADYLELLERKVERCEMLVKDWQRTMSITKPDADGMEMLTNCFFQLSIKLMDDD